MGLLHREALHRVGDLYRQGYHVRWPPQTVQEAYLRTLPIPTRCLKKLPRK